MRVGDRMCEIIVLRFSPKMVGKRYLFSRNKPAISDHSLSQNLMVWNPAEKSNGLTVDARHILRPGFDDSHHSANLAVLPRGIHKRESAR